jgi:hypothetical protein
MPTTLRFDDGGQLTTLRLAGESTPCFALLRFMVRARGGEYAEPGSPLHDLFRLLGAEWSAFNGAPLSPVPLQRDPSQAMADA